MVWPAISRNTFQSRRQLVVELPLFLPVFHRRTSLVPIDGWREQFGVEGCISNAYFLYKDRELRSRFLEGGLQLPELYGYDGFLMTDSGAFQGFSGKLLLENKKIVRFQDRLGADVISPLDLVTPPGDKRADATWKLEKTQDRIREAKALVENSVLASVQQGGRFLDLRRRSLEGLLEMGIDYLALGSLVPFFNRNHDIGFVGQVMREARTQAGSEVPIHVYGAGDPVELPFFYALGANIFDSASYGHYAQGGWYMTPYGAFDRDLAVGAGADFACPCPFCHERSRVAVFAELETLASHNLWTILETVRELRRLGRGAALASRLEEILTRHQHYFPGSALATSWRALDA